MKRIALLPVMAAFIVFSAGCSHQLTVNNLRNYQNMQMQPLEKQLAIGIVPSTEDIHSQRLMKGIGTALGKYSAAVLLPYAPGNAKKADVIAKIAIKPEYEGSGWNFLINFPGFLIWTPAWHGYNYNVSYQMEIMLTKASDNSKIDSFVIPVDLKVRHADINRTWTEISWFEVGAIALVGGVIFTQYDDGVTPLLVDKIEVPIGDYVAQEIVSRINNHGGFSMMRRVESPLCAAPKSGIPTLL